MTPLTSSTIYPWLGKPIILSQNTLWDLTSRMVHHRKGLRKKLPLHNNFILIYFLLRFGTEERYYNSYADAWAKLNKVTFTPGGEARWSDQWEAFILTIDQSQALYSGRMLETLNYMRCKKADKIVPSVTMSGVSPNVGLQFYQQSRIVKDQKTMWAETAD